MLTEKQKELIVTINRMHSQDHITDDEYFAFLDLVMTPQVQYIPYYRDTTWPNITPLTNPEVTYETTCYKTKDDEE